MSTLTLAIIKPHILKYSDAYKDIHRRIAAESFKILKRKTLIIEQEMAKEFYAEHTGKFFYERLVWFMSSGLSQVMILQRYDAINKWREMLGPTNSYLAHWGK